MKKLIVFTIPFIFICCTEKKMSYDIENIEVFAVSFGINFPVNVGESAVKNTEPYFIEDEIVLNQIEAYIKKLRKSKSSYKSDEIYLRCKLNCKNKMTYVLDYNKTQIKLNGNWYEDQPELIQLILNSKKE